jgi:hypothetical protein
MVAGRPLKPQKLVAHGPRVRAKLASLTRPTFQITHATDSDTNAERDFIIAELSKTRVLSEPASYQPRQKLSPERVNHYVCDGQITVATLTVDA